MWLNGTVGSGKSTIGAALAGLLPKARFLAGDDLAGPGYLPTVALWSVALDALLMAVARSGGFRCLVVAYSLDAAGYRRLRAACSKLAGLSPS